MNTFPCCANDTQLDEREATLRAAQREVGELRAQMASWRASVAATEAAIRADAEASARRTVRCCLRHCLRLFQSPNRFPDQCL